MATITDKMLQRFFEILQASKLPAELQELLAAPTSSHFCVIQQGENDALKISMPRLRGKLGLYDASTNTPALFDGSGVEGDSYIVSTGATVDFGRGPTVLAKDDILEHRDGRWLKVGFALTQSAMIAALGYTPEDIANKATDFTVVNDDLYPSVKAVSDHLDSLVYKHSQGTPAATWTITHNKGKNPSSVRVKDTAGTEFVGSVTDSDLNTTVVEFESAFAGSAILKF